MAIFPTTLDLVDVAGQTAARTDQALRESELYATLAAQPCGPHHPARQLLRDLLQRNAEQVDQLPYPSSVQKLVRKEFARLERIVDEEDDSYFDIGTHRFRSDLRIAMLARIPVGPEHLEIDGLPRRLLFCGGWRQGVRFASLWARAGGIRPFYVLHLAHGIPPQAFLFAYSPQAQRAMFLRIAECLTMNPNMRGVLATSWWHDPRLAELCPHLAHLREGWVQRGAESFRWGKGDDVIRFATENSLARQQLVDEGKYDPVSYMAVWLRDSLIAWAAGEQK